MTAVDRCPDDLQRQARALGDPTRLWIFRHVHDADGPVDIAELTDGLGISQQAIRQHLTKLVAAGLLVEGTASGGGVGRPRLVFRVDPVGAAGWLEASAYEQLAVWLAEGVAAGESPVEVGTRVGRRLGAAADGTEPHVGVDRADPVDRLAVRLAGQGFDPIVHREPGRTEIVAQRCAYEAAAVAAPATVCALHLGLLRGLAESIPGLRIDRLVPGDPRHGGCRLSCSHVAEA